MKRKHESEGDSTPKRRSARIRREADVHAKVPLPDIEEDEESADARIATPTRRSGKPSFLTTTPKAAAPSPTPGTQTLRGRGRILFSTPTTQRSGNLVGTPARNADRSAKRKSARFLLERSAVDPLDEDGLSEDELARAIWGEDEQGEDGDVTEEDGDDVLLLGMTDAESIVPDTPSKRGRGAPRREKARSPSPPTNGEPQDKYFWDTRPGGTKTSNNTLASISLPTYDDYFSQIRSYVDRHESSKRYLFGLHRRSFPQWRFELSEQFNVCLYGYGSKRKLTTQFAEWLTKFIPCSDKIVVVNGYTPSLTLRNILVTILTALLGTRNVPSKLGSTDDILALLMTLLSADTTQIYVFINSIDASPVRKTAVQAALARLASSSYVHILATADTTNFPLLWDSGTLEQFNWVFHDATTFAPWSEAELAVVDEVNALLGRKSQRLGGREGVAYVLKSLPENARALYRVLISELLTYILGNDDDGDGDADGARVRAGDAAIEYRVLYQKASEQFICSSEMALRTLLKEFHDHQMVVSRRDATGVEVLSVPLAKEEMEGVLEDLIV